MGEPLIRYAYARAAEVGTPVNLKQALAENTGFGDESFDVVSAHILFHEVNDAAAGKIIAEAARVLRPGGVFDIIDFDPSLGGDAYSEYRIWADHTFNNEVWGIEYHHRPFIKMLEQAGFEVSVGTAALSRGGLKKFIAHKPA